MPKLMNTEVRLAAEKARRRKKLIGTMGSRVRSSQATKATTSVAPTIMGGSTPRLVQPWALPRTRPQTMPNRPALTRARPGRSSERLGPRVSVRRKKATGSSARPIGTLTQKMNCQEKPSTMAPPMTGPSATARPAVRSRCPGPGRGGRRHGRREDRQGQRRDDRAADALQGARRDQGADARRHGGGGRAEGEDREAHQEHALAPEAVAQRGAGQEEDGEGQGVGVDGPLEPQSEAPRSCLITGSAVVTTRLSSDTMNTATPSRRTSRSSWLVCSSCSSPFVSRWGVCVE